MGGGTEGEKERERMNMIEMNTNGEQRASSLGKNFGQMEE